MTPEGKLKNKVKALLKQHKVYYFMPVQTGYGSPGLDFHCAHKTRAFAVETKYNKPLSARQVMTRRDMEEAGMRVFVVGEEIKKDNNFRDYQYSGWVELEAWLLELTS